MQKTICSCLYYRYISIDYEKSFFLTLTYFCNILNLLIYSILILIYLQKVNLQNKNEQSRLLHLNQKGDVAQSAIHTI